MLIEIDQAAVSQDLALVGGERSHVQLKLLDGIAQNIGLDALQVALECLPHIGDEHIIPQTKGGGTCQLQGQHAPVDEVGAVTLGGVLGYDIGTGTQHTLAAGGLLTGRAVAGLDRKDGRGDLDIVPAQLLAAGHGVHLCQQSSVPCTGAAGSFLGLHGHALPDNAG